MGGGGYFLCSMTLSNIGHEVVKAKKWHLYGYFMRLVEKDDYPYPLGYHLSSCGLKIFHIGGSLYKFEPDGDAFTDLKPYERVTCRLKAQAFQIARSDSMPKWYVTSSSTMPKIMFNTDDESLKFVKDFTEERQYKRRSDDKSHPFTPQQRFEMFKTMEKESNSRFKIIPTPLLIELKEKVEMEFNTRQWVIIKSDLFLQEIKQFSGKHA